MPSTDGWSSKSKAERFQLRVVAFFDRHRAASAMYHATVPILVFLPVFLLGGGSVIAGLAIMGVAFTAAFAVTYRLERRRKPILDENVVPPRHSPFGLISQPTTFQHRPATRAVALCGLLATSFLWTGSDLLDATILAAAFASLLFNAFQISDRRLASLRNER